MSLDLDAILAPTLEIKLGGKTRMIPQLSLGDYLATSPLQEAVNHASQHGTLEEQIDATLSWLVALAPGIEKEELIGLRADQIMKLSEAISTFQSGGGGDESEGNPEAGAVN